MPYARINWTIKGIVTCPECDYDNDFMKMDEWWMMCGLGDTKTEDICDLECEKCKTVIRVTGSDH